MEARLSKEHAKANVYRNISTLYFPPNILYLIN